MTFCHSTLLDEALDAISAHESLVILGRPMSGRSTLLLAIAQHLREAGREPVLIRGMGGLDPALSSLGMSQIIGPASKTHDATVSSVFSSLIERLSQHDQALLIDDLDDLDDSSSALLQHAAARSRVAVVATGLAPGRATRRVPFPGALRLDMRALSFEECAELLADVLGGAVESATVARLMTKTAGLPGLMVRFASAARHAGRLVERGGVWQGTSDLWNPGISRAVSVFLSGLSAEHTAAMMRLARAGVIDLPTARAIVGDQVLLALEDRQLIEVIARPGGALSVTISPPLLAHYLQREISPLVHALTVPEAGDAFTGYRRDRQIGTSRVTSIPAGDAALIQDRQRAEFIACQAAWEADRCPDNARTLIRALIGRGVDRREIVGVIEHTDLTGADDDALLRYCDTLARWHAWVDGDPAAATDVLCRAACAADSERVRAATSTLGRYLESVGAEPPAATASVGGCAVPEPLAASRTGVQYAPILSAVIEGDGSRALGLLAAIPDPHEGRERAIWRTLQVQAMALGGGDLEEVVARANAYRNAAVDALEPLGIALHSHEAATGLFFQGRYAEAETVLDEALTIGVPPFPHMPLHVGNLTMFAALQARRGRFDLAEATQRQAERFGVVHSYVLLGSTAWSRAYIDALREGDATMDALWESGMELERRGFVPAALAVWTMAIAPWSATRLRHVHDIADGIPGELFAPMISYQEALAAPAPEPLQRAYAELRLQGRPFFAGVLARALAVVHRHDEVQAELWRTRANDVAEEVGCAPLDLTPGRSLRAAVTPREQDILRLVVAGRSNAEIAASCFLSVRTVENHVHRIIRKLGVSSRAELGEVWK